MSERILSIIAIALAALVAGLAFLWYPQPPARELPKATALAEGDFILQTADGLLSLAGYRGKLVLLYFGYTYCPDICPTSLTATTEGLKRLKPEEAARVAMIFISVDPERDTPAHLKEYTSFFHPGLIGATGTPEQLREVAKRYGVFYARQKANTAGGYVVDHTSDTYLLGADGKLIGRISHATPPDQVAAEIRRHLN